MLFRSDQRIAAAVTVARENADKPEVVKAENEHLKATLAKMKAGEKTRVA